MSDHETPKYITELLGLGDEVNSVQGETFYLDVTAKHQLEGFSDDPNDSHYEVTAFVYSGPLRRIPQSLRDRYQAYLQALSEHHVSLQGQGEYHEHPSDVNELTSSAMQNAALRIARLPAPPTEPSGALAMGIRLGLFNEDTLTLSSAAELFVRRRPVNAPQTLQSESSSAQISAAAKNKGARRG